MKLFNADNREALKELPDNSVDSVITDPPYGLSFMNKKWDYDVPSIEFWREVYRVLKPGGHILSFGGTRTYHRMVVNIEDAGFEIRDQIMWIYGSGFPKSLNILKSINKSYICEYRKIVRSAVKSLKLAQVKLNEDTEGSAPVYVVILQEEGQENKTEIGVVVNLNQTDIFIFATRELIEENTTSLLRNILVEDSNREKKFITSTELNMIIDLKIWNLLQNLSTQNFIHIQEAVMNLGTSIKPANEPIVLARKPLSEKSIAENVLRWRTGGLNIDGCRVEYISESDKESAKPGSLNATGENSMFGLKSGNEQNDTGRFPANVILECCCDEVIQGDLIKGNENYKWNGTDCSEGSNTFTQRGKYTPRTERPDIHTNPDCPCYIMDEQSGTRKSCKRTSKYNKDTEHTNTYTPPKSDYRDDNTYSDTGGASRFFYRAKVSKKERNLGLDGFEEKENKTQFIQDSDKGKNMSAKYQAFRPARANTHPTLKPINLLTYLCRLITPPNGVVLDPFMGSGSTGVAALLEGFDFIGMELEKDYFDIAEQRIKNYELYKKIIK